MLPPQPPLPSVGLPGRRHRCYLTQISWIQQAAHKLPASSLLPKILHVALHSGSLMPPPLPPPPEPFVTGVNVMGGGGAGTGIDEETFLKPISRRGPDLIRFRTSCSRTACLERGDELIRPNLLPSERKGWFIPSASAPSLLGPAPLLA